jgi:penicillin V acylase-like amidase (Ntn superfamily)
LIELRYSKNMRYSVGGSFPSWIEGLKGLPMYRKVMLSVFILIICGPMLFPQAEGYFTQKRIKKSLIRKALPYMDEYLYMELERSDDFINNCIKTLNSLKKLNDTPVYEMTWYGDFQFSSFIKTGMPPYEPEEAASADECSGITAANAKGEIIFGRNQDGGGSYIQPIILHTDSPDGYASVTMSYAYRLDEFWEKPTPENTADLLLAPYRSRDGINEYGLTVSSASAPDSTHVYDPDKITLYHAELTRLVLEYAKTVEEAVQLFRQYNNWTSRTIHHLFSDVHGNTIILEYYHGEIVLTPKVEPWVVMTNFSIRNQPRSSLLGRCWRYDIAYLALQAQNGIVNIEEAMEIMRSISILVPATKDHPEYRTNWSAVYNQTRGEMMVCGRANYEVTHSRPCPLNTDFKNIKTKVKTVNIPAGKPIRAAVLLKNKSPRWSHSAGLEFFLSERKKITETSIFLGEKPLPSLAPGKKGTLKAKFIVPPDTDPGSYFVVSRIKLGDLNRDENTKNNTSPSKIKVTIH